MTAEHRAETALSIRLSVCPHDTAKNLFSWFSLTTYLQRQLSQHIHFEPTEDFLEERSLVLSQTPQLVYANPYSAAVFSRDKGYVCVARPKGVFDESLVVVRNDFDLSSAVRPIKVASATSQLITHPQGVRLLAGMGLSAADLEFVFVDTHMAAVKSVVTGGADLGIVFNETWEGLTSTTKSQLSVLSQSTEGAAFHCFMASPAWAEHLPLLQAILIGMSEEPKGKQVLDDLHISGFEAVSADCVQHLHSLIGD